ncbi:exostosin-like 2 isoform X2 [Corticium candelabrum]|uniref:exostosin-like 2 isoform X2 n=1 Tax=Corticium candelabrum TaxID=121492 RepID=UPI002E26E5E3|nr:exostosin-like 2 isoform X2 [Corticium candelabrum]
MANAHSSGIHQLSRIIVVWNNVGEPPPVNAWRKYDPHPVPVHFIQQDHNRMRNRLHPFSEIDTEAVLILDDDILVSANDITFAFSVWQQFSDQIVGFVPRKHVLSENGVYTYGSRELEAHPRDVLYYGDRYYSLVLIGAAFVHFDYLKMFKTTVPQAVNDLIDETQNCDDLVFNVMVGKALGNRKPTGVYVRPSDMRNLEAEAESGYKGMWHRADHLLERSYCLNRLAKVYGQLQLPYSKLEITQFSSSACNK